MLGTKKNSLLSTAVQLTFKEHLHIFEEIVKQSNSMTLKKLNYLIYTNLKSIVKVFTTNINHP